MTDLDVEIRRAIGELAAAAPVAPTADELQIGRPVRMPSRRPAVAFAVLAAAAIVVSLFVVRLQDDGRRNGVGSDNPSTTTSSVVPADPTLAYGTTAEHWLPIVEPHLPPGFKTVIADESAGKATVVAVDGDAHLLEVSISDDAEFLAKQSDPPERSVDEGDFYAAGATSGWLHTRSGRLLAVDGCAGGFVGAFARSPCDPVPPGTDKASLEVMLVALAHEVSLHPMEQPASAVGAMDAFVEEALRATAAQLFTQPPSSIGDPLSPTLGQYSARRGSFTFGPGPTGLFADVRVALRDRPASIADDEIIRTPSPGTIAAMYDAESAFVLVRLAADGRGLTEDELAQLRIDLPRAVRSIAGAVAARSQAGSTDPAPALASTVPFVPPTAPADPCADPATRPPCDERGTTSTTSVPATYTVVAGDYFIGIAQKLGVPLVALLDENAMSPSSLIAPGQQLLVPPAAGARPMPVGRDGGLPQTLADVFVGALPTGFELHEASYGRSSSDLMRFGAGRDSDRLQVLVYASHGGPVPALPFTATLVPAPAGRVQLNVIGEHGWSYMAVALDADGGAAPLNADELTSVVRALDAAVGASA